MIPLSLVTGFLGSGKTTLLVRLARSLGDRRVLFLVNEFSPRDVDGVELEAAAPEGKKLVRTVVGGSIFCTCKVAEFIDVLADAADFETGLQGVIIEASGIANPGVFRKMLADTRLDERFDVRSIVSVIDPGTFLRLRRTLPNIEDQVRSSSVVLVNKVDQAQREAIDACREVIAELAPRARVFETVRGEGASFDPFEAQSPVPPRGELALCADPNYRRLTLEFDGAVDLDGLVDALRSLGPMLLRAKGYVPTELETVRLDVAGGEIRVDPAPYGTPQADGRPALAVIVGGAAPELAIQALRDAAGPRARSIESAPA